MLRYYPPCRPVRTDTRTIYVGANDPKEDKLVRQEVAIPEWQSAYLGLEVIRSSLIGHARPMEQPEEYSRIVEEVVRPAVV